MNDPIIESVIEKLHARSIIGIAWSLREVADAMSISPQTVSNIIRVDEVRREVFTPSVNVLTDSHIREVAKAPPEQRAPLIEAAAEKYGTNLQDDPGDLIYWLEHLQTELLDAANYIETLLKRFREVLT